MQRRVLKNGHCSDLSRSQVNITPEESPTLPVQGYCACKVAKILPAYPEQRILNVNIYFFLSGRMCFQLFVHTDIHTHCYDIRIQTLASGISFPTEFSRLYYENKRTLYFICNSGDNGDNTAIFKQTVCLGRIRKNEWRINKVFFLPLNKSHPRIADPPISYSLVVQYLFFS